MKLKILSLLLILGLMVNVGCTSSNDESADTEAAEATDGEEVADGEEAVEGEEAEAEEGEEVADGEEETDDFASDEEVVADTGDEAAPTEGATEEAAASEELPAESLETTGDGSQIVAEDGAGTEGIEETPAPEEAVFDSASSEAPADTSVADAGYTEAPKMISVKKIAETPYTKNGTLVNTVYLARQGDDVSTISQKIGVPSEQVLQVNPNLAGNVKVGDKVYYNSPKRPQDSEKMLTYYEDNGLAPASYVAKSGDNIRTISKNLLGDSGSWKEVWATNLAVESKDELTEGTELRYWPEGSVAAAAPVQEAAPVAVPETPQMPEPTPEAQVAAIDPAPAPAAGQDDFALPDDMANAGAAGTVANEPPPPPPPPSSTAQKSVASNDEKDLTFMLSAGGLLLVGVGVLLGIIRKGRARKMSMNTHTQI